MAVDSKVEICNIALTMLGEGRQSSIPGTEDVGIVCDLVYGPLLDHCLQQAKWSFATTRQTLAASAETNLTQYEYMYQLPVDPYCIKPICFIDSNYEEVDRELYPWVIEGRYLYSDYESAILKYIGRVTDPTKLDSTFVMYFAAFIAKEIAVRVAGDESIALKMEAKAAQFYREAFGGDAEDQEIPVSVTVWGDE